MDESLWSYLPAPALYAIFQHLTHKDLISAGTVCRQWYLASRAEFLWKNLFYQNFKVDKSVTIATGQSWYQEFKRLCYNIPIVETETLEEHQNQVLHVSFSHNGEYFATCSKDGYVLVWNSSYPVSVKYHQDMKLFSWKYTQYSQFNESDTLLLVSGVHFGSPHSTSGEIVVFNLQDFTLQCRVVNKPYDIFGTWYSDEYLLSGDLHWLAHLVSRSILWINKASQETESEHVPITQNMYRFYNRNASTIRAILIANCLPNSEKAGLNNGENTEEVNNFEQARQVQHGNPVSHRDLNLADVEHLPALRHIYHRKIGSLNMDYVSSIQYNEDYRQVEMESLDVMDNSDSDSETSVDINEEIYRNIGINENFRQEEFAKDVPSGSNDEISENSQEIDASDDMDEIVTNDKYLIFTTGVKTYTPHQIGFKRIKPFKFPKRLDPGPSLKERLQIRERRKEQMKNNAAPEPDWLDYDAVADKFDKVDHLLDLHGHIIGMKLSPDHRYLYVNSRPWPKGYIITNPLDPPPIAQQIDIHVIDLVTLKEVGKMLRSHRAYTPNNECFFIFLDVCDKYVASGAEDHHGYLWDRHYGLCLSKYPHGDVVNCVAFNPRDPEMLVTTGDDTIIKVWRSKNMVKQLGLDLKKFPAGIDIREQKLKKKV